jgi:ribosomal 30S subunit maturation factor RimM
MTPKAQDLVGLTAHSRDGGKLGKITTVICDSEATNDCLVIKRSLFRNLVVPSDVVEPEGDGVTVPFAGSFLDAAPQVASKGTLSAEESARLQRFFHPGA